MQPPRTFWSCPEFCVVASGFGLPLVQVHLVRDTTQLDQLVQELEATLREVDDLVDHYTAQRRRRKRVKPASVRYLEELSSRLQSKAVCCCWSGTG